MRFEREVDLDGLEKFAGDFAKSLTSGSVVFLKGELGSGKTQFVQFLVNKLSNGKYVNVSSPTFSIHNSYVFENYVMDHFDFYRLKSLVDLDSTGFWDVVKLLEGRDKFRLILVEWPELLKDMSFKMPVCEVSLGYVENPKLRKIALNF